MIIISTGIKLMPTTLQECSQLPWKKHGKQQDGSALTGIKVFKKYY